MLCYCFSIKTGHGQFRVKPISNMFVWKLLHVRNSTTLVNSLMNITIVLKFIFIIDAFREYNSHLQDITS